METLVGELVTGNYFPLLGIGAALGPDHPARRPPGPRGPSGGGSGLSVLAEGLRWGSVVVGRSIVLSGRAFTVVGVAPADFPGSIRGFAPDFFAPIMMIGELMPLGGNPLESRGWNSFMPVGRLQEGATIGQVRVP